MSGTLKKYICKHVVGILNTHMETRLKVCLVFADSIKLLISISWDHFRSQLDFFCRQEIFLQLSVHESCQVRFEPMCDWLMFKRIAELF